MTSREHPVCGHLLSASSPLSSLPAVVLNVPSQANPKVLAGVAVLGGVIFVLFMKCVSEDASGRDRHWS